MQFDRNAKPFKINSMFNGSSQFINFDFSEESSSISPDLEINELLHQEEFADIFNTVESYLNDDESQSIIEEEIYENQNSHISDSGDEHEFNFLHLIESDLESNQHLAVQDHPADSESTNSNEDVNFVDTNHEQVHTSKYSNVIRLILITIDKLTEQQRSKIGLTTDINIKEILSRIILTSKDLGYVKYCSKRIWNQFVKNKNVSNEEFSDIISGNYYGNNVVLYHQCLLMSKISEKQFTQNIYSKPDKIQYQWSNSYEYQPHHIANKFGFGSLSARSVDNIIKFVERMDRVKTVLGIKNSKGHHPNLEKFVQDLKNGSVLLRSEDSRFSEKYWDYRSETELDKYLDQFN